MRVIGPRDVLSYKPNVNTAIGSNMMNDKEMSIMRSCFNVNYVYEHFDEYKLKDEYKDGKITISLKEYYELESAYDELCQLYHTGVDNWEGYSECRFDADEQHDDFWSAYCDEFPEQYEDYDDDDDYYDDYE